MDPQPVAAAELQSWLIALAVGVGIVIAVLGEVYLRQQEWLIDELREEIERLKRERRDGR